MNYVEIYFEFDDEDGINPTGIPAIFMFTLKCSYIRGCRERIHYDELDHPAEPPEVDIYHVKLDAVIDTDIELNDTNELEIVRWFGKYIDTHQYTYEKIYKQVCAEFESD